MVLEGRPGRLLRGAGANVRTRVGAGSGCTDLASYGLCEGLLGAPHSWYAAPCDTACKTASCYALQMHVLAVRKKGMHATA